MNIDRMRRYNDAKRPRFAHTGPEVLTQEQRAMLERVARAWTDSVGRAFDAAEWSIARNADATPRLFIAPAQSGDVLDDLWYSTRNDA